MSDDSAFTLAAAGDAILTRTLRGTDDDGVAATREVVQGADAGLVNLEVLLHDYEGYPSATSGGTYMRAAPSIADDLAWLGFDLYPAATNHAGDYGHTGMEATMEALEQRGLAYAGLGRTLADARAPAYVETPAGRVALVSAVSYFVDGDEAGTQRPDMQGRPGVAPLRVDTTYEVPESVIETLREAGEELGLAAAKRYREELGFRDPDDDADAYALTNLQGNGDVEFEAADDYRIAREIDDEDREAFREALAEANRQADWVIASLHTHEGEDAYSNHPSVPAFLEEFARDAVENGADAFVAHGPHLLRGIEVYEGSPIFYSLGDFAMQNETVSKLPPEIYERYGLDPLTASPSELFDARVFDEDGDRIGFLGDSAFWESVVPVCAFDDDGDVTGIELHPLDLGYEEPRANRGIPRIAEGETATAILDDLRELSAPYGTDITVDDGVGYVDLD